MDQQKGVDIAIKSLQMIAKQSFQAILLGTGDPVIETACRSLEVELPDKIRAVIRFDVNLSKRMYAGGDVILIPSRYEPCGLTQMIAMRYGCVPLARATGGLSDTIFDDANLDKKNGYLFDAPRPENMSEALVRAINDYANIEKCQKIQLNGMKTDFSWEKSALEYAKIYIKLLKGES
jgi:starch synthase